MGRRVGKTENLQISLIRLGRVIFKGWKLGMKTWEDPETRDDILARSGGSELRMILRGVFFGGWKLGDSHEVPKKNDMVWTICKRPGPRAIVSLKVLLIGVALHWCIDAFRSPKMAPNWIARMKRLDYWVTQSSSGRRVCWSLSCATTWEPSKKTCHARIIDVKRKIRCPQLGLGMGRLTSLAVDEEHYQQVKFSICWIAIDQ